MTSPPTANGTSGPERPPGSERPLVSYAGGVRSVGIDPGLAACGCTKLGLLDGRDEPDGP
jgi:hypothetical protein